MALGKKNTSKSRTTPGKSTRSKNGNRSKTGIYLSPRGDVSIGVPAFWTLRQTNDDLEVESPTGSTSVIVTAFKRDGKTKLDSREYLAHFLETAHTKSRPKLNGNTSAHAKARFRDVEGDNWEVLFLSNGKTLLLATCNSGLPSNGQEAKLGLAVLSSLKLKK
jgi:hypothetical protein